MQEGDAHGRLWIGAQITPYEGHGMYTHVQIIKIISNTPPDFECPKDISSYIQ